MNSLHRYTIARQDIDISTTVLSGQAFRWKKTESGDLQGVDGDNWYQISPNNDSWQILSNAEESEAHRLLGCDMDIDKMRREIVSIEPRLDSIARTLSGLSLMRFSDPVEVLFGFLCSANNHIPRIRTMVAALAGRGSEHTAPFRAHRFPSAETLAAVTEIELRGAGFGYRAATIPRVAREVAARGGLAYLIGLRAVPYDVAHLELTTLPGVGPKLADCICLFGLHHREAIPVDTHIWQAAVRLYRPEWHGKSITAGRYREIGSLFRDRFGANASLVQQMLFYDNHLNSVHRTNR